MEKFLLLPLALLLSGCSRPNAAVTQEDGQQTTRDTDSSATQATAAANTVTGAADTASQKQAPIEQGIKGQVLWVSGNQMPSPDVPPGSGRRGIQRTVYIYELTNASQTKTTAGVFHTDIQTRLVTQVTTDADGNFAVSLKPGKYSLFTKEDKGLFASQFDGEMNIFPVEVQRGQVTSVEFLINYNASY